MSNKILRDATPADPGFSHAFKDPVVVRCPDGSEKVLPRDEADEEETTEQRPQEPA